MRGLDNYRVRIQENGVSNSGVSELGEDHAVPLDPVAASQVEVVQSADAYEAQMEKLAVLEALAESVDQADRGKVHDARKAIGKLVSELKGSRR